MLSLKVREAAYRAYLYPDEHQSQLLDQLLTSRHHLAVLCGFSTYAHRALRESIAGSPDMVDRFLGILSSELKPRAEQDYKEMLTIKSSRSGRNCVSGSYGIAWTPRKCLK